MIKTMIRKMRMKTTKNSNQVRKTKNSNKASKINSKQRTNIIVLAPTQKDSPRNRWNG